MEPVKLPLVIPPDENWDLSTPVDAFINTNTQFSQDHRTAMINWLHSQGYQVLKDMQFCSYQQLAGVTLTTSNPNEKSFPGLIINKIIALFSSDNIDNTPHKETITVVTLQAQQKAKTDLHRFLNNENDQDETTLIGQLRIAMEKHWSEVPQSGKTAQEFCEQLAPKLMDDIRPWLQARFDEVFRKTITDWCTGVQSMVGKRVFFHFGGNFWGTTLGEILHMAAVLTVFSGLSAVVNRAATGKITDIMNKRLAGLKQAMEEEMKDLGKKIRDLDLKEIAIDDLTHIEMTTRENMKVKVVQLEEKLGQIEIPGSWKAGLGTEIGVGVLSGVAIGTAIFLLDKYLIGPWMERFWDENEVKKHLPGQLRDAIVQSKSSATLLEDFDNQIFDTFLAILANTQVQKIKDT